jgi:ABC-type dipeptide/oligopeptide/nickel transport system permease component
VIGYLVRRTLLAFSIVVTVSFAGFVGLGLSFDPAYSLVTDPEKHAFVRHHYHLDDPILSQYWRWLTGLFRHGFGTTVSTNVLGTVPPRLGSPGISIGPAVWDAAAITFELVGAAMLLVILGSAAVGALTARRRRLHADVVLRGFTYLGASVPTFLVGDLLLRAVAPTYTLGPNGRLSSTGSWFVLGPPAGGLVDWFRHMTLPVVTLAVSLVGVYARYVRTAMIETLSEPYVAVARAKGLPERHVIVRHVLRNSLIPFTSLLSLEFGAIIGASLAADAVFGLGGLASTFLGAVRTSDPFLLTALFVTTAAVVSAFTLAGDLLVGLLDPRVSVRSKA